MDSMSHLCIPCKLETLPNGLQASLVCTAICSTDLSVQQEQPLDSASKCGNMQHIYRAAALLLVPLHISALDASAVTLGLQLCRAMPV